MIERAEQMEGGFDRQQAIVHLKIRNLPSADDVQLGDMEVIETKDIVQKARYGHAVVFPLKEPRVYPYLPSGEVRDGVIGARHLWAQTPRDIKILGEGY